MASTDELMDTIEQSLIKTFKRRGFEEQEIKIVMGNIKLDICRRHQGDQVRIKKPPNGKAHRNAGIKKMFDGTNMAEVCERFKVTRPTVYKALKIKTKK